MFDQLLRTKYRMVLVKKTPLGYEYVKTLVINPAMTQTAYKGDRYDYTLDEVSFKKGNKAFIFKDIDTSQTVLKYGCDDWTKAKGISASAKMQLAREAMSPQGMNINLLMLIIVAVAALMGGLMLGMNLPAITAAVGGG